jgi:Protein of unknown function (DUF2917)
LEDIMNCSQALQPSSVAQQDKRFTRQRYRHAFLQNGRPMDGDCILQAGQALTVQARQAGILRIVQGWAWITFRHADQDSSVQSGDHFLGRGESLQVPAGQAVVLEPLAKDGEKRARFSWQPATPACRGA